MTNTTRTYGAPGVTAAAGVTVDALDVANTSVAADIAGTDLVDTDLADGDFDEFSDGDATRCTWNESVCVDEPTHFVVFAEHAGGGDAQLFCARHYVLTLAELLELHLPECSGDLNDHVLRYGALEG